MNLAIHIPFAIHKIVDILVRDKWNSGLLCVQKQRPHTEDYINL